MLLRSVQTKERTKELSKWRAWFILVRWKPKMGENEKIRWHEMHSFTLTLSHSLCHLLSLSLSLRDWGFPVTWALGSPLLILSLVLYHISFSLTIFHFRYMSLCKWLPFSPCFLSLSPSLLLLSLLSFLSLLSLCLQHICDRAAWQEGRQADGHWDLEWLRSGASGAHGEHVFPTSVECQRTPIHCLSPQHSSLTD